ncbi:hypothetical protein EMIT0111MI5_11339 [Burkholderia sp. IT-111MI5]
MGRAVAGARRDRDDRPVRRDAVAPVRVQHGRAVHGVLRRGAQRARDRQAVLTDRRAGAACAARPAESVVSRAIFESLCVVFAHRYVGIQSLRMVRI